MGPPEVVFDSLRSVASTAAGGSPIVFDYLDAEAFILEKVSQRVQQMQWMAVLPGKPIAAGFDPLTLAADLDHIGLRP